MSRGMQYTGSVAAVSISVFTCENAASILFNVYTARLWACLLYLAAQTGMESLQKVWNGIEND